MDIGRSRVAFSADSACANVLYQRHQSPAATRADEGRACQEFGPRLRPTAPAMDYAKVRLPRAEHAARSTVWLQHRMLLGDEYQVLGVARAVEKIQRHAATLAA